MRFEDRLPIDVPTTEHTTSRVLYLLLAVTTALGAAHHIDHIIRGNHVGWPITHHVNPFTYSLAIYPIVALGLYLTLTDRAGDGYWAGVFTLSAFMLAYFHISPWAVEPPQDVILPYATPAVGYLAFVILLALIAAASLSAVYAILLVYRKRKTQPTRP
ncbi:MAG: hypothetical protein A07HN63_00422 [uncultured archaeon A07HN63]|nr:MAG: hypothetical protein A07HN63_00422 [uncultured archaeon A07HN63]